jgi:copper chaperone
MNIALSHHELQVKGMSCQHCVKAVTQAVQAHDGAAQVKVDLPSGQVSVVSHLGREEIIAAIVEEGYEVQA